jgi:hypothetical protein
LLQKFFSWESTFSSKWGFTLKRSLHERGMRVVFGFQYPGKERLRLLRRPLFFFFFLYKTFIKHKTSYHIDTTTFWEFWHDLTVNPNGGPIIETFWKIDTLVWNVLKFKYIKSKKDNNSILRYLEGKFSQ